MPLPILKDNSFYVNYNSIDKQKVMKSIQKCGQDEEKFSLLNDNAYFMDYYQNQCLIEQCSLPFVDLARQNKSLNEEEENQDKKKENEKTIEKIQKKMRYPRYTRYDIGRNKKFLQTIKNSINLEISIQTIIQILDFMYRISYEEGNSGSHQKYQQQWSKIEKRLLIENNLSEDFEEYQNTTDNEENHLESKIIIQNHNKKSNKLYPILLSKRLFPKQFFTPLTVMKIFLFLYTGPLLYKRLNQQIINDEFPYTNELTILLIKGLKELKHNLIQDKKHENIKLYRGINARMQLQEIDMQKIHYWPAFTSCTMKYEIASQNFTSENEICKHVFEITPIPLNEKSFGFNPMEWMIDTTCQELKYLCKFHYEEEIILLPGFAFQVSEIGTSESKQDERIIKIEQYWQRQQDKYEQVIRNTQDKFKVMVNMPNYQSFRNFLFFTSEKEKIKQHRLKYSWIKNNRSTHFKEFLSILPNDKEQGQLIREIQEKGLQKDHNILKYYTIQSFLYPFFSKGLRSINSFENLPYIKYPVQLLEQKTKMISQQTQFSSFPENKMSRICLLSPKEREQIKKNKGQYITLLGFTSFSKRNAHQISQFTKAKKLQSIDTLILRISSDTISKRYSKNFIEMENYSMRSSEKQVLIFPFTIVKIIDFSQSQSEKSMTVQLQLCDEFTFYRNPSIKQNQVRNFEQEIRQVEKKIKHQGDLFYFGRRYDLNFQFQKQNLFGVFNRYKQNPCIFDTNGVMNQIRKFKFEKNIKMYEAALKIIQAFRKNNGLHPQTEMQEYCRIFIYQEIMKEQAHNSLFWCYYLYLVNEELHVEDGQKVLQLYNQFYDALINQFLQSKMPEMRNYIIQKCLKRVLGKRQSLQKKIEQVTEKLNEYKKIKYLEAELDKVPEELQNYVKRRYQNYEAYLKILKSINSIDVKAEQVYEKALETQIFEQYFSLQIATQGRIDPKLRRQIHLQIANTFHYLPRINKIWKPFSQLIKSYSQKMFRILEEKELKELHFAVAGGYIKNFLTKFSWKVLKKGRIKQKKIGNTLIPYNRNQNFIEWPNDNRVNKRQLFFSSPEINKLLRFPQIIVFKTSGFPQARISPQAPAQLRKQKQQTGYEMPYSSRMQALNILNFVQP